MRQRIHAFPWESTPLGAIAQWPETLRTAVDICLSSPFPLSVAWGRDGIRLYNDAHIEILGHHHPSALGRGWCELWPEERPSITQLLERVFAGETILERNRPWTLNRFGKPEESFLSYAVSPIRDADGLVAGALISMQDNTLAVLGERDRERLRVSEERSRQILSSTRDCIKVLDLDGCLVSMNLEGRQRLGIGVDEDVRGVRWAELWKGDSRRLAEQAVYDALHAGTGRFEGNYATRGGENTWWDVTVTPILQQDGTAVELLVVSREITARKQTEQALIRSEKLIAVGRLAASIAHEINNPLEAITNLFYLASRSRDVTEIHQHLELAERELRRVTAIASQTLRFHKQSTRPTRVRFEDLIESVLTLYQARLLNAEIEVRKRARPHGPILCFEGEIRQLLANLVGNAIDAMTQSGGRLLLRSRLGRDWSTDRAGVVLTVADTGCGMSAQVQEQIFDAFFTTKGIGGTGLGLWICREIIARHQGSIRLRSSQQPGRQGTVFTVFLPFEAARRASSDGEAALHANAPLPLASSL